MQDYLQSYAKQLMRDTLEDGVSVYGKKVKTIVIVLKDDYFIEVFFFQYPKDVGTDEQFYCGAYDGAGGGFPEK